MSVSFHFIKFTYVNIIFIQIFCVDNDDASDDEDGSICSEDENKMTVEELLMKANLQKEVDGDIIVHYIS